jgi:uncharacterized protein YraI
MRSPWRARLLLGVSLLALTGISAAENAFTTHSATLYAGPDDSYPPVADLDADSPLEVMGCLDDWSWCDVAFEDYRGWVYSPDIAYVYEGGYVPLYTYAPSLGIPVVEFTIGGYWDRYYQGRPWYDQREEWIHREPRHHRPSEPPPNMGPPPRSAWIERPTRESGRAHEVESDRRPMRLGSARDQPPRPAEPPRHVESPRAAEPPHAVEPPRHEERAHEERAPAVQRPEVQRPEVQRPEGGRHEEPRHDDKRREDRPGQNPQVPR